MRDKYMPLLKLITLSLILTVSLPVFLVAQSSSKPESNKSTGPNDPLTIRRCEDFKLTGKGDDKAWLHTDWNKLTKLDQGGTEYESKYKMVFSSTGIYVLFSGQDNKITTQGYNDFDNIYDGDVFEVFFHPVPSVKVYFEYEVNQLDKELILMISNIEGHGYQYWIPWNYNNSSEGSILKKVDVVGGEKKIGGTIRSWTAEVFFPYAMLGLLPDVAPKSGSIWHANFCRLDYDTGTMIKWSWTPLVKESFHELETFRSIKFE